MGEDTVDKAIKSCGLSRRKSKSRYIKIHGYIANPDHPSPFSNYGSEAGKIQAIMDADPILAVPFHKDYPYIKAELVYAIREEMARTIEDFLARRIRILFLDANVACQIAPVVAKIMASELGRDGQWEKEQVEGFKKLARNYLVGPVE